MSPPPCSAGRMWLGAGGLDAAAAVAVEATAGRVLRGSRAAGGPRGRAGTGQPLLGSLADPPPPALWVHVLRRLQVTARLGAGYSALEANDYLNRTAQHKAPRLLVRRQLRGSCPLAPPPGACLRCAPTPRSPPPLPHFRPPALPDPALPPCAASRPCACRPCARPAPSALMPLTMRRRMLTWRTRTATWAPSTRAHCGATSCTMASSTTGRSGGVGAGGEPGGAAAGGLRGTPGLSGLCVACRLACELEKASYERLATWS